MCDMTGYRGELFCFIIFSALFYSSLYEWNCNPFCLTAKTNIKLSRRQSAILFFCWNSWWDGQNISKHSRKKPPDPPFILASIFRYF